MVAAEELNGTANKKVVLDLFASLMRGDADDALVLLADDGQVWFPGPEGHQPRSKEDLRAHWGQLLGQFPEGLTATPRSVTAEDDRVAVEYRVTGPRADGTVYDNEYCIVAVVHQGLVQSLREHVNILRVGKGS